MDYYGEKPVVIFMWRSYKNHFGPNALVEVPILSRKSILSGQFKNPFDKDGEYHVLLYEAKKMIDRHGHDVDSCFRLVTDSVPVELKEFIVDNSERFLVGLIGE